MTALRPLFALFQRSLREQSRTKFTSVSRAGIVLILLLFIVSNERGFLNQSAPGLQLLMMLVMLNFFAITIFGLSTFASAVTEEKEEATLGLLRMTRLNPLAILLGKSTARLFEALLLLAAQLPFTMLCVTLGGVAQWQILRSYAVLASYLFFFCNVSLLWSVICRRSSSAAWMTAITGAVLYVLPFFLFGLMMARRFVGSPMGANSQRAWYDAFAEWLLSINPVSDLTKTVQPRGSGFPFAADSIGVSLIGGVIAFGLAWVLFGRFCNSTEEAVPRAAKSSTGSGTRRRFLVSRPRRFPIAWKDFHFLAGGYKGILVRTLVYAGMAALLVGWSRAINGGFVRRSEVFGAVLRAFGIAAFSLEIGLASSRILGVERKRKTLGGLFALPRGTARLIGEKVLGVLPLLIPSAGMFVLGNMLIAAARGNDGFARPFAVVTRETVFIVSEFILFAVLVTYLSLRMRRAALAAGIAIMYFGNMFAAVLLPIPRLVGYGNNSGYSDFGTIVVWMFIVVFAAAIPGRTARAAAEE